MEAQRTVLVFVKYPEPGRVKTRLAAMVGPKPAAALYHGWIGAVLGALQPLRPTTRVVGYHEGAPRESFAAWEHLADDWWPQPPGDLGDRLTAGFRRALAGGGTALAVGTDCLEIDALLLGQAFDLLASNDVVFGPTPDGGYYLVGLSSERPDLFASIRWSSKHTLADHLHRCRQHGWSFALLPARHDLDTWDDWAAYLDRTGGPPPGGLA
jgi:rSAM/selenodomain-associated transferase 1